MVHKKPFSIIVVLIVMIKERIIIYIRALFDIDILK